MSPIRRKRRRTVITPLLRRARPGHRARRAGLVVAAIPLLLAAIVRVAPLDAPEGVAVVPGTVLLDVHGEVLSRDASDGLRIPVALDAIAPRMLDATIAAEDRRFFQHPGVDPLAIARAAATLGSQPSGASTITQQLARRLYLRDDGGPLVLRKVHEAFIALQLEARRSKRDILDLYLNDVYYGRGAYGVEAAARAYFGISAANLDLAHAAYLAGLPQRPSVYDDADAARERQSYVLRRMVENGVISRAVADAAAAQTIEALPAARAATAPHFAAYALAELAHVRPDLAGRSGLVIETTLDAGLQREAERLAHLRLDALARRNVTDAAIVAIEPSTGRIQALVGSATDGDPAHGGAIDMTQRPRQPGSALKPFLYAAAFEHGYTAATPLLDVPTTFATNEGPYAPLDADRRFRGVVPLRVALASSLNVPAVRTLDALGVDAMLEVASRFGLTTLSAAEQYGLALTLGAGEVPLLELTAAYAALGAQGLRAEPYAVARVRDAVGRILYEHQSVAPRRVLSRERAYVIADILSDADARVPTFGISTPFELPFPVAAKSGTTSASRDNWTLGFTPEIAVGVWVGNADGSPMNDVSGVDGAAPIWRDVMMAAALGRRMTWLARPAGVVDVTVCAPTGLLPGPACPAPVRELFVSGTEPRVAERYYARDADGVLTIDPPVEARPWARDAGYRLAANGAVSAEPLLRIVAPAPGSVFYLSPELASQQLFVRAAAGPGIARVRFVVDGRDIGDAPADAAAVVWRLDLGTHTLVAHAVLGDGALATATSTYEVRAR